MGKKRGLPIRFLIFSNVVLLLVLTELVFFSGREDASGLKAAVLSNERTASLEETDGPEENPEEKDTSKEDSKERDSSKEKEDPEAKDTSQKSKTVREKKVDLAMVGDMLLHSPVSQSGRRADGSYNYDALFRHIRKDIKKTDIALVNEEVVLAGGISGYPLFNGRFEVGNAIEKAGFDVVLHATNHAMDQGRSGIITCLNRWKKAHPKIKITGMYASKKAADKITVIKKNGIRVAFLNYTYGTNGISLPPDMPYAVNMLSESKVKRDVKKAKKQADFIVVMPHWGTEYQTVPDSYQLSWTKIFADLGVDLVIGTHPHVIQPVKWVKGKKGHRTLIYYSLGNYVNSYSNHLTGAYQRYCGGMAKVTLSQKKDGKVKISEADFVPLITHWSANGKITTYKMSQYSEKMARANRLDKLDRSFSYQGAKNFFKRTVNAKFLEDM